MTFYFQKDMIFFEAQVIGGSAGVLSTVHRLSHVYLQSTILMDHIWVTVFNVGLAVFKPRKIKKDICNLVILIE